MSTKLKIAAIYIGVAVISVGIITMAMFASGRVQKTADTDARTIQPDEPIVMTRLEEGVDLVNQRGEALNIEDLQGKVWVFAQFYAACPQCAKRNLQSLKALHDKHSADPDFRLVCITVTPEKDGAEELAKYSEVVGANPDSWYFLTGKPEELMPYMVKTMLYPSVKQRTDEKQIALYGAVAHDLSLAVFDRDLQMRGKFDLFNTAESNPELHGILKEELDSRIEYFLTKN